MGSLEEWEGGTLGGTTLTAEEGAGSWWRETVVALDMGSGMGAWILARGGGWGRVALE